MSKALPAALAAVIGAALAAASPATAGQVTIVLSGQAAPYMQTETELKTRLPKLGHTTRTVMVDDLAKGPAPAARAGEVFVAVGTRAACWLRANLPPAAGLAYCMVSDPQANGLEQGRQTPGVSTDVPLAAQFGLIAQALPQAATVGVLYRSDSDKSVRLLAAARAALPKGWKVQAVAVDKHESVAKAIEELLGKGVDVVWTAPDSTVYDVATVRSLLLTAIRSNTPVFGFSPAFVRAGALIGVGIDPAAQGRQAAAIADLLLKSPPPASPPAATRPADKRLNPDPDFQIAVNLIVAGKLSIALPKDLIGRAAQVFREEGTAEK